MALAHLQALASRYPNVRAALAQIAELQADLTLPTPTVHVVSDVHGEYVKLRHVINNASGSLRPLMQQLFGARSSQDEIDDLLATFYYPRETWLAHGGDVAQRRARLLAFVPRAVEVIREMSRRYTLEYVAKIIPDPFDAMFREMLFARELARPAGFVEALVEPFLRHGRDQELVRMIARVVRNLSVGELVVAGDLGDRGPRIDKVIELVMQQPNATITWGNHDASWMAACLGLPAAIMTVIRVSLRYRRLSQLEEGYGIPMAPLERLRARRLRRRPVRALPVQGRGPARRPAHGAHAEGRGDPAVQAGGPAVPQARRLEHAGSRAPASHRSRGGHGHDRRDDLSDARHEAADDRLGRSVQAVGGRGGLSRAADALRSSRAAGCGGRCRSSSRTAR